MLGRISVVSELALLYSIGHRMIVMGEVLFCSARTLLRRSLTARMLYGKVVETVILMQYVGCKWTRHSATARHLGGSVICCADLRDSVYGATCWREKDKQRIITSFLRGVLVL